MEFLEINNEQAILTLPKKVEHNIIHNIDVDDSFVNYLVIDFQQTTKVTLSGILYLICISAYFNEKTKVNYNTRFYCEIINIREYLLNFMMNFGFLQQMSNKGNLYRVNNIDLMINRKLIETEKKFVNHQIAKSKSPEESENLIMPASTIVMGEKRYFESYVRNFQNQFIEYFDKLINSGFISLHDDNSEEDIDENFHDFTNTIIEIIKNIYDHAISWGIGAIHANESGVEIVYYDIGVGITNSMKSCGKYPSNKDINLIKLALTDGVSSKSENGDNKGRGFTVMQKFIEKRNGILSIRTDRYHLVNNKTTEIKWFPGTQIVVFIPKK